MLNAAGTVATLAAIAAAEGLRRLPDEAIVLHRLAYGRWRLLRSDNLAKGLRMVSWCIPVSLPLVLSEPDLDATRPASLRRCLTRLQARGRRVERHLRGLRVLALIGLLILIIGLPVSARALGAWGLTLAAITLLALTVVQAGWTLSLLRRCGLPLRAALLASARLLNPFAAARAPEIVQAAITRDVPRLAVAFALLGRDAFVRDFRSLIYDTLVVDSNAPDRDNIASLLGSASMSLLLARPDTADNEHAFCPRCAASFDRTVRQCSDCSGVDLQPPHSHVNLSGSDGVVTPVA